MGQTCGCAQHRSAQNDGGGHKQLSGDLYILPDTAPTKYHQRTSEGGTHLIALTPQIKRDLSCIKTLGGTLRPTGINDGCIKLRIPDGPRINPPTQYGRLLAYPRKIARTELGI